MGNGVQSVLSEDMKHFIIQEIYSNYKEKDKKTHYTLKDKQSQAFKNYIIYGNTKPKKNKEEVKNDECLIDKKIIIDRKFEGVTGEDLEGLPISSHILGAYKNIGMVEI